MNNDRQSSGLIAEERVRLKLLERGLDVARPTLYGPIDLLSIYDNSVIYRLQVKSASQRGDYLRYTFTVKNCYKETADYLILVGLETDSYWVIPTKKAGTLQTINCAPGGNNTFDKYYDAWAQLEK